MSDFSARIPPHSLDPERAVLGAVLLEGRAGMDRLASSSLVSSDFYLDAHRVIYRTMWALYEAEQPIDLITVSEALKRAGTLAHVGGNAALGFLVEQASIMSHVETYADETANYGQLRDTIARLMTAMDDAFEARHSAEEIVSQLQRDLDALVSRRRGAPHDAAESWTRIVGGWTKGAIKIGLDRLDRLTGGVTRGQVIAVAGRTSGGKTAYSWDRAIHLARNGHTVDFLTLEENEDAATRRGVANISGVSLIKLRGGEALTQPEFERAEDAVRELQTLPLTVRGVRSLGSKTEAKVLGAVALSRAEVIIIDHIHKIELRRDGKDDLMTYRVKRVMDRLETIAGRDDKIVWVNAQLSREVDTQKRPPVVADIKDSSSVEETARQVHLLYWPWKQGHDKPVQEYEIIVGKNSEGGTGKAEVEFTPDCGRFTDRTW